MESSVITIDRKHIRCRPTGYGIVFGVIAMAMLLGSMNYNNNLGLLLSFLLAAIALASRSHTRRNLVGLQIAVLRARSVFAGETAVYELEVLATAHFPESVSFSFSQSEKNRLASITALSSHLSLYVPVDRRGWHDPGPLTIETEYPMGLFRAVARVLPGARCLVYPRPVAGFSTGAQTGAAGAGRGGKELPGIDDFAGLQPYLPGEPTEHIYWKAFSRGQGLQMKRFSQTAGERIVFDFDTIHGVSVEGKLSLLCDAVLKAHRLKLLYGLNLPGESIPPDTGSAHYQNCLRALALFQTSFNPGVP